MILTLYRKWPNEDCTIGELHVDNAFFCFTLEDRVRPDGVKVKHETAIPAGRYQVILNWSNRFKRVLPRLLNVPMFDGILIHAGNNKAHTSGCILVGKQRGQNEIYESRAAFNALFDVLRAGAEQGKIWIEIHNPPNFANIAPSVNFQGARQGKIATKPEKSKVAASPLKIPAFPVAVPDGFSTSKPEKLLPQAPKQAAESLKSGNALPVSLVTIQAACELFLRENGSKLLLWLTLSILIALLYHEWRERQEQRKEKR